MRADRASFTWRDADRTVLFGPGSLRNALGAMVERGLEDFDLLTTPRALGGAKRLATAAATIREVAPGGVPEAAERILAGVSSPTVVAMGGGRVIDTAKAVAAVNGQSVVAIPTTLSGAEMTGIHRLPAGAEERARGLVRPDLVIADPSLMTSQPESQLRASAMNAIGHAADSLYTPFANPVSRMIGLRGVGMIADALDQGRDDRDRTALALGSVLCGYAIDSGLFAIHHVICQTLVRAFGVPHAETNAAMLPPVMGAMRGRAPGEINALARALGTDPDSLSARIAELGRPHGLGALGARQGRLEEVLDAIQIRPEFKFTPDPPSRDELRAIIEAAW